MGDASTHEGTATAARERPIIFGAPMIRAIMAGRKTQDRRAIFKDDSRYHMPWRVSGTHWQDGDDPLRCPFGESGGRLWVRETWATGVKRTIYRADYDVSDGFGSHVLEMATGKTVPLAWRSSTQMPRWASRITLEVTRIRVERLQEISEADAAAEGAPCRTDLSWDGTTVDPDFYAKGYLAGFADLWDAINGKRPDRTWAANPWVWVVEFKRL